jgi:hypothetical protein
MLTTFLTQIGITSAATLAVGWAAIQFLGKSWIDDRFKRQFEDLQLAHKQEMARLQLSLDVLKGQMSKLHDQEFVVLPEIWRKMAAALGTINNATDFDRTYSSTLGMNEGELNEYLETAPLLTWEKGTIKEYPADREQERDAALRNMLDWAGYRQSRQLTDEFRGFLQSQRIFMSQDLASELDRCGALMDSAVAELRRFLEARQAHAPIELVICPKLKAESVRMADAVRAEIHEKLFAGPVA